MSRVKDRSTPEHRIIDTKFVAASFSGREAVEKYARDVDAISLWEAERTIFDRFVHPGAAVLDVGCGAGRATIGLASRGYAVHGVDISLPMIDAARHRMAPMDGRVTFSVADALRLPFAPASFDACLFSCNGLMQIPGADGRLRALLEMRHVLRGEAYLIFSTPERETRSAASEEFWRQQRAVWSNGTQNSRLLEFGDVLVRETAHTMTYLHFPTRTDVERLVELAGLELIDVSNRRSVATESVDLEARFGSMECLMWVARTPSRRRSASG